MSIVERREVVVAEPVSFEDRAHEKLPPRARYPDDDALSGEIGDGFDPGGARRHEHEHVVRHRHEASHGVRFVPAAFATHREVSDRRVGETDLELPPVHAADALEGALRRFGGDVPTVVAVLGEYFGESAADDEKRSPGRGRTDAEELFGRSVAGARRGGCYHKPEREDPTSLRRTIDGCHLISCQGNLAGSGEVKSSSGIEAPTKMSSKRKRSLVPTRSVAMRMPP